MAGKGDVKSSSQVSGGCLGGCKLEKAERAGVEERTVGFAPLGNRFLSNTPEGLAQVVRLVSGR